MTLIRQLIKLVIMGFLSTTLPVSAQTDDDPAGFVLCNRSQARLEAAIAFFDSGQRYWRIAGWYSIGVDQCRELGRFDGEFIYYFAEKSNGRYSWPNRNSISKTFCVPQERFSRRISNSSCRPSERFIGFAEVPLRQPGVRIELGY